MRVAQRPIVVANIGCAFLRCLLETQRAGADRNAVAGFQLVFELRFTIDEHLIRAATQLAVDYRAIDHLERTVVPLPDVRVITRGARIVQDYKVVRGAADGADALRYQRVLPLSSARIGDFKKRHNE